MASFLFFIAGVLSGFALFSHNLPKVLKDGLKDNLGKTLVVTDDGAFSVEVKRVSVEDEYDSTGRS